MERALTDDGLEVAATFSDFAHLDAPPGPWLERFRQEMRGLLLAELDLRLQPVEGLLEACRKSHLVRS